MKSTRRGFLSFLGGGAVAGPGALKKAMASAASTGSFGTVARAAGLGIAEPQCGPSTSYIASDILELMRRRAGPAVKYPHQQEYPDLEALKSVSATFKTRRTREKTLDEELARQVERFIKEHKLNWVGLTEERLLSIVKQAAGE